MLNLRKQKAHLFEIAQMKGAFILDLQKAQMESALFEKPYFYIFNIV